MQMPRDVLRYIEERAGEIPFAELKRSAEAMSAAYREGKPGVISAEAYLVTRMPATYAASYTALAELAVRVSRIETVLDVGCGTGAASVAVRELFRGARITLMERDASLMKEARALLPGAEFLAADAARIERFPERDLAVAAYSVGEIGAAAAIKMWDAARVGIVILEPGTPRGFALIRQIRDELLARGAHIAAPCPGGMACPIAGDNWCHFAARVERSSLHRRLKGGDLGYEDEKFSYIAVTRQPVEPAEGRIVRRPQHRPGLIELEVCTAAGLQSQRVSKREREAFRQARHAAWGARWPGKRPTRVS